MSASKRSTVPFAVSVILQVALIELPSTRAEITFAFRSLLSVFIGCIMHDRSSIVKRNLCLQKRFAFPLRLCYIRTAGRLLNLSLAAGSKAPGGKAVMQ